MWNEKQMLSYLQENLKEKKQKHSLNVSKTAVVLAKLYGVSVDKARISGLVHDCAKDMNGEELIKIVIDHGIEIDEVSMSNPSILHGLVGSIIAREVMEIDDEDILMSIRYHTTGRKNMSVLEKIIYLADYIEPLRVFDEIDELRRLSYIDLDLAVIKSLENAIKYVISQNGLLHIDTIHARNYLLSKDGRREHEK